MRNSKKLEKFKNKKYSKKLTIMFLVFSIGIGFSFLSNTININGIANLTGYGWLIYLDNVQVSENSVESELPIIEDQTTIRYSFQLSKPGDLYEFTFDVINGGPTTAVIRLVDNTVLDERLLDAVEYNVTYLNGKEIKGNDKIQGKSSATYKVSIKFLEDISEENLLTTDIDSEFNLSVEYVSNEEEVTRETNFTNLVKSSAINDSSINFESKSSSSNGNGLYLLSSTKKNYYPIYYYRGAVTNNNARFAGYCWKIVRTTETGGVKLVYNGVPNGSGQCVSTTGTSTQIGTSSYNSTSSSPAYVGYMYGKVYSIASRRYYSNQVYGNEYVYRDGTYTLVTTKNGLDKAHHYTCFSSSTTCTSLYYAYYTYSDGSYTYVYYITLSNGESMDDAVNNMEESKNSSTIKGTLDNWFKNTFTNYFTSRDLDYNDYIEDAVWCNDRSVRPDASFHSYGGIIGSNSYNGYYRLSGGLPDLNCSNKNDAYTVYNGLRGNRSLTYPVGLLTSDEVMLAGGQSSSNSSYYLYTNQSWWTMTPDYVAGSAVNYYVNSNGYLTNTSVNSSLGVRPSIVINKNVEIAPGGDGTSATPYEFIVN